MNLPKCTTKVHFWTEQIQDLIITGQELIGEQTLILIHRTRYMSFKLQYHTT